jgi:hypothetical protein
MQSPTSTPAMSAYLRPPFLNCANCSIADYDPTPPSKATVTIDLCSLHKTNLMAATTNPVHTSTMQSSPLSPDSPPTIPGATRTLATTAASSNRGRRLTQPLLSPTRNRRSPSPNHRGRHRSRSPLQHRARSPPHPTHRSRGTVRLRSDIPQAALNLYRTVQKRVLDQRNPVSVRKALDLEHISRTSWDRKKPMAELQIIDYPRFEKVVEAHARYAQQTPGKRICQRVLSDECKKVLCQPALVSKRLEAMAHGEII